MRLSKARARAVSVMVSTELVALAGAGVAAAGVVTVSDPKPKCSQGPALDVRRATWSDLRADAWAHSVAKGAMHGPYCGDYLPSGRIARG